MLANHYTRGQPMPLRPSFDIEEKATIRHAELKPLTSINEEKQRETVVLDEASTQYLAQIIAAINILQDITDHESLASITIMLMMMIDSAEALRDRTQFKNVIFADNQSEIVIQLRPQIEVAITKLPTTHSTLYSHSRAPTGQTNEPSATSREEKTQSRSCLKNCTLL